MPSSDIKVRVRLSRLGPARELTHLAQIAALRRAASGSGLPLGGSGRPRLSFGPAISVGYESLAEYVDWTLGEARELADIARRLGGGLEPGLKVEEARRIPLFFPSLDSSINVVAYEIRGPFPEGSAALLERALMRPSLWIEKIKDAGRRRENVDARPLIRELSFDAADRLRLVLRFGPKRTLKPEALLEAVLGPGLPLGDFRILRKALLLEMSGGELAAP